MPSLHHVGLFESISDETMFHEKSGNPYICTMKYFWYILVAAAAVSCSGAGRNEVNGTEGTRYAEFFSIVDSSHVVTFSPFGASPDTIDISVPAGSIVCMSTSYVAYLDAVGKDSVITGVSGLGYVSSPQLTGRDDVYDIGYDAELDYERIVSLKPDYVVAYSVSSVEPQYVAKLRSLGIRLIMANDHLESHPLARAEYIRFFGALTGCLDKADSVFHEIEANYIGIMESADTSCRQKVLFNIPYSDQWFIPGGQNYMARLVSDAGGETLGAEEGARESSVISIEQAYLLAKKADVWLNPGWCRTKSQLLSVNPVFSSFGIDRVYNNILRTNDKGGNDFWESGAARPDLILEDLVRIFSGERGSFNYYVEVQ